MQKQLYPSWRYHETEPSRIVQTPKEDSELGPGWSNPLGVARSSDGPPAVDDDAPAEPEQDGESLDEPDDNTADDDAPANAKRKRRK